MATAWFVTLICFPVCSTYGFILQHPGAAAAVREGGGLRVPQVPGGPAGGPAGGAGRAAAEHRLPAVQQGHRHQVSTPAVASCGGVFLMGACLLVCVRCAVLQKGQGRN